MLEQTTRGITMDCELNKYVYDCEDCGFCEGEQKMKYIIELDEIPNTGLYKARGANTLVFDRKGIENILMPYKEEHETDWSKVAVDTPVLVRNYEEEIWYKRHFAKYEDDKVYVWSDRTTSWTGSHKTTWKFVKLAEEGEE